MYMYTYTGTLYCLLTLTALFWCMITGMDEFIKFVKPAPIDEAPTKKQKKQMAGQKKQPEAQQPQTKQE